MLMVTHLTIAQKTPSHYWHFDKTNPLADSTGSSSLDPTYFGGGYDIKTSGPVSKYLSVPKTGKAIVGPQLTLGNAGYSIEFAIKPGTNFNQSQIISRRDNAFIFRMYVEYFRFTTIVGGVTHNMDIDLQGINQKSLGYYLNGNWHHFVLTMNATTGYKAIYVDGQLLESTTTNTGTVSNSSSNRQLDINTNTTYFKYYGDIDEVATYETAELSDDEAATHSYNFFHGNHYSFASASQTATTAVLEGKIDTLEYARGWSTSNILDSQLDQLRKAPYPRYRPKSNQLRNANWMQLNYFSGNYQTGVSTDSAVSFSRKINLELARNWNYYLMVNNNTSTYTQYNDTTKFSGAWLKDANANPDLPAMAITFWSQINPGVIGKTNGTNYSTRKDLPDNYYVRNSSGQFLQSNGSVITQTSQKILSPDAPLDSLVQDGLTQKFYLQTLCSKLTRPLDYISENDEVIKRYSSTTLAKDPTVTGSKSTLSWDEYQSKKMAEKTLQYKGKLKEVPQLQTWNTKYSQYQICGDTAYRFLWKYTQYVNDPIEGNNFNDRMATQDFYVRWPSNWAVGTSAWNGWQRYIMTLKYQLAYGDSSTAPFVGAGWSTTSDSSNVRPAQWLGLLKALVGSGARYFHTGYFNEAASYNSPNPPPVNPREYTYQVMMPSYAQAAMSRVNPIYDSSYILTGDAPLDYTNGGVGYSFLSGDPRILTVVRKHKTRKTYMIFTTIQPLANDSGNAELSKTATISLDGQTLSFTSRRQGSIYVYDNNNASAPVFYQVDEWHESTYPTRWSKDIVIEAENADNALADGRNIKTEGQTGTNFTSYTTGVKTTDKPIFQIYTFSHKDSTQLYLWIRAAKTTTADQKAKVSMDGMNTVQFKVTSQTYQWIRYKVDNTRLTWTNLKPNVDHILRIFDNNLVIYDKIILTTDPNKTF